MQAPKNFRLQQAENLADGPRFRNPMPVRPRTALAMPHIRGSKARSHQNHRKTKANVARRIRPTDRSPSPPLGVGDFLTYAPQSLSAWAFPLKPTRISQLSEIKQFRILAWPMAAGLAIAPVLGHTSAGIGERTKSALVSACRETWPRG
jgi:hypothetical protein